MSSSKNGDPRALRGLLQCPDANVNTIDDRGRTPIYLSSWKGHVTTLEVLLDDVNLDINKGRIKDGGTAYSVASQKNFFNIMKRLVGNENFDADIGWSIYDWAKYRKKFKDVDTNGQVNFTVDNTFNITLLEDLISSARLGNLTKVLRLIDLSFINIAGLDGRTALYEACENGHLEIVKVLLNKCPGSLNEQEPDFGSTPLYVAAAMGYPGIVAELIMKKEIDVNKSTKNRTTQLIVAIIGFLGCI